MARINKARHIAALEETALAAISYVGRANYAHRQRAAEAAVEQSAATGRFVNPEEVECS
jgi:predicted transcriptional regulator